MILLVVYAAAVEIKQLIKKKILVVTIIRQSTTQVTAVFS